MRIIKVKNYDEVSVKTANMILGQVNLKPDAVLGLATGGSPVGAYKKIVEAYTTVRLIFPELQRSIWMNTEESKETTNRATGVLCRKICLNM